MHDDIECAIDGRGVGLKVQKADAAVESELRRASNQVSARPLTRADLIGRTADNIGSYRESWGQARRRHRERSSWPFHLAYSRHQANANGTWWSGRQAGRRIQIQRGPLRREPRAVDAVMKHLHAAIAAKHALHVRGDASRIGDDPVGTTSRTVETAPPKSREDSRSRARATAGASCPRRPTPTGCGPSVRWRAQGLAATPEDVAEACASTQSDREATQSACPRSPRGAGRTRRSRQSVAGVRRRRRLRPSPRLPAATGRPRH